MNRFTIKFLALSILVACLVVIGADFVKAASCPQTNIFTSGMTRRGTGCNSDWTTPFINNAEHQLNSYNFSANGNVSASDIQAARTALNNMPWNGVGFRPPIMVRNGRSGGVSWSYSMEYDHEERQCLGSIRITIDACPAVTNTPATAIIDRPRTATERNVTVGSSVLFSGHGVDDGPIQKYQWGSRGPIGAPGTANKLNSATTNSYTETFNVPGTYTRYFRVNGTNVATGGNDWSSSVSVTVNVANPTPAPSVTLTASPENITSGNSSTLSWTVSNATNCTAGGGWSGSKSTSGGSESTGILTSTKTYTLTCTGSGGSASDSVTVTVGPANNTPNPPVIIDNTVTHKINEPQTFSLRATDPDGDAVRYGVDWNPNTLADEYTAFVSSGGIKTVSYTWSTPGIKTFRAFAYDGNSYSGWTTHTIEVCDTNETWNGTSCVATSTPPTLTLTANGSPDSASVFQGDDLTLAWSGTNLSSCDGSPWTSNTAISGTETIANVTTSNTYSMTCLGTNGSSVSDQVTVTVVPPSLSGNGCVITGSGIGTCEGRFTWQAAGASSPNLYNLTTNTTYTTGSVGNNQPFDIELGTNQIQLRDGGTLLKQISVSAVCASGLTPVGGVCVSVPPGPSINLTAKSPLIRKGNIGKALVEIDSTTDLTCDVLGAQPARLSYDAATKQIIDTATGQPLADNTLTTKPLTSAKMVTISCVMDSFSSVPPSVASTRIEVTPSFEEI